MSFPAFRCWNFFEPSLEPRRAAVALLIRVVPSPRAHNIPVPAHPLTISEFFELDWVNDALAVPEILFLHRHHDTSAVAQNPATSSSKEAHVAFPGGRTEADDEGGLYTGAR